MKARVIQIGKQTRVYVGTFKFEASQSQIGWHATRIDCWQDEWISFTDATLYDVVEQVKKHCAKLKRQEKKMIGAN
jgi:ferric-dicitrate binding protein FerR (iron transport regulator)